MDLNSLRYFRVVAREGSITAAARVLGVSQPTLSVALRNLEQELGTRLVTRTRAGVELTAPGAVLNDRAEALLFQVDETVQHVLDMQEGEVGRFTIGCQESLGVYFLPGFLHPFLHTSPAIDLDLWTGPSAEVRERVLERAVHYGLVVNCEPHDDLVITPLFEDAIELFTLRTGEARPAQGLDAARRAFESAPLIWCDRPVFRGLLRRVEEAGVKPGRRIACGDLELVKSLALEGVGVAMLPGRVARYGHPGRLRPLSPELPRNEDVIHLVYRGDLHRTRGARRLRDALLGHGKELAEAGSPSRW